MKEKLQKEIVELEAATVEMFCKLDKVTVEIDAQKRKLLDLETLAQRCQLGYEKFKELKREKQRLLSLLSIEV